MKEFFTACLLFVILATVHTNTQASTPAQINDEACLAFAMPDADTIFKSPKKIFAHYFHPFPISIDNRVSNRDYYNTQLLNPKGENYKWAKEGGFLRSRPLLIATNSDKNWELINMEREVRMAIARGIAGWTFDIMGTNALQTKKLQMMLQAAQNVDSRFKIVLMPDMSALKQNTDIVITIIKSLYKNPALYHLDDGRLVIAPFLSESVTPSAWLAMLGQLSKDGISIAFIPTFLSLDDDYIKQYKSISAGYGTFATAVTGQLQSSITNIKAAHEAVPIFMNGVGAQDYRPKNGNYWEANNSLAYRNAWMGTIKGNSDWVQLTTWNDFSETTQIAPYTDDTLEDNIGTGYYNLTGYYAAWFVTGKQPKIIRDTIYYFYRKEPTTAIAAKQTQQANIVAKGIPKNQIELLAFLKSPGTLQITIGDKTYSKKAPAGITSFMIPLQSGAPNFSLARNGSNIISLDGTYIYDDSGLPSELLDLTYWSGSASSAGTCTIY
jgi:hypothetical protein